MAGLLDGRVAVVTGGASGNGRGIALAMAQHGAKAVVVADLRETPREGGKPTHELIQEETQSKATFVECNVTKVSDLEAAVEAAEAFGGVDVMVNNAGIVLTTDFLSSTEADYQRIMDVNVKGMYFGAQVAARRMVKKGGGAIIIISSIAGIQGMGGALYSTTKGAVRLLTYALAGELGPMGIRVNAIHPGIIETAMTTQDSPIIGTEQEKAMLQGVPLGRIGKPQDIGNTAVYLASDLSSYVNGASIIVDGGWMRV